VPAIARFERHELDDKVDVAPLRIKVTPGCRAEYSQTMDAVPLAEDPYLVEMIGDEGGQRSHTEIVPLRATQRYNRVTAANLCATSSSQRV
jgi:hypothetical protein